MRILFAGTPSFAVTPLEKINGKHRVCGVLTAPDILKGRKHRLKPPPVKVKAEELKLNVLQPERLDKNVELMIADLKPEILVVAAYGKIFGESFLQLFPKGGINLHPSLLPKYRGPSPIPAAILGGESETGVTVQKLSLKVDSGEILGQTVYKLNGRETTFLLTSLLSGLGSGLLIDVLDGMERGTIRSEAQDESKATYCKKIRKQDGFIDWKNSAVDTDRMVRAYNPWPGGYTYMARRRLTVKSGCIHPSERERIDKPPGKVLTADEKYGFLVNTGKGVYCIQEVQPEYRKAMLWKEFLNGHPGIIGAVLGG